MFEPVRADGRPQILSIHLFGRAIGCQIKGPLWVKGERRGRGEQKDKRRPLKIFWSGRTACGFSKASRDFLVEVKKEPFLPEAGELPLCSCFVLLFCGLGDDMPKGGATRKGR